jgi:hypothetical protein
LHDFIPKTPELSSVGAGHADENERFASKTFRLDINALRALSVLAVVGYHLEVPGFAGGFVGVDVFLVITGYLDPISAAALASGIHGLIATQSECRAFVDEPGTSSRDPQACRDFNRSTLDFVLNHAEPSIVVLGSNWSDAAPISFVGGKTADVRQKSDFDHAVTERRVRRSPEMV